MVSNDDQEPKESQTHRAMMAVLFADMVSYSVKMAHDEEETIARLEARLAPVQYMAAQTQGRIIKSTGDGFLAVFPTASQAMDFAIAFQDDTKAPQTLFRIGVHCGEVMLRGADVFGHAVNFASRIEAFAPDGGICVSHDVFLLVRRSRSFHMRAIGARRLKNLDGHHMLYLVAEPEHQARENVHRRIDIGTIGGLKVVQDDSTIAITMSPLSMAVLACLSLSPGCSESVSRLVSIIAPDTPEIVLQAVGELQAQAGDILEISGGVARLNSAHVKVDLLEAEDALKQGNMAEFLVHDRAWPDRLLMGLESIGPQFMAWLEVTRTEWKDRLAALLEAELGRLGDEDLGLRDVATALLIIENAHERAARRLIRSQVKSGNPGAAQRVYDTLNRVLRERYDIGPRPETTAALQGMGSAEKPVLLETRHSRAVPLRLQVREATVNREDLVEQAVAFRSELMAGLACFRGWSVVEGVQSGHAGDIGSDYAVTISSSAGSSTQIEIGLSEIATGRLVWQDLVDVSVGQVETARRKVVGRIAATLEVFITTDRTSIGTDQGDHQLVDEWLQAERLIGRWTPQAHDKAAEIFSSLIERAPNYASAYASLASLLNVRHVVRPGLPRDAYASRRAHGLANQAVELDPLDARNQLAVGWSAALDDSFDKASINLDMATRLNPHSPRTLMSCAMGFGFLGEHGRAAEILAHSLDCAPMLLDYQWCYAASIYLLAGNAEAALEAARRSGDVIIDNPGWTAAALVRLGRRSEAAVAYSQLVRDVSANWHGPEPATNESVRHWFVHAYPFRTEKERELLDAALQEATLGLNRPLDEA